MRLPEVLSSRLSASLGVPVHISSVSASWNQLGVQKLTIMNPPKTKQKTAFSCDDIRIAVTPVQFFKKDITIDTITIDNIYLDLEFDSATTTDGNWTRIMQNIPSSEPSPSDKSLLIKKLIFTNIEVDVYYVKEGGRVQKLPPIDRIELTDISSEGEFPTDQLMNSVLGQMLKAVFIKQNLKNMLDNVLNTPGSSWNRVIKPFKGFFNTRLCEIETNTDRTR